MVNPETKTITPVSGSFYGHYTFTDKTFGFDEIEWLPPVVPEKIIGVAINYQNATGLTEDMTEPLFFLKSPGSLILAEETIISPFSKEQKVWGECELTIVIKNELKNATSEQAKNGILGYTICNDVSAQNIHKREEHLARSKAADTFCPIARWVDTGFVPAQQIIEGYHNKTQIRRATLDKRLWNDAEIVMMLSKWITLRPGDIILTGAPPRVRERLYFSQNDSFLCRIEGLGELRNTFQNQKQ